MTTRRISAQDVAVELNPGGKVARFLNIEFTIEDTSKATAVGSGPDGWVRGKVSCKGKVKVDNPTLIIIQGSNKSWREIPPTDILFFANDENDSSMEVELFGCKFFAPSPVAADRSSEDEIVWELNFEVTSPDFVNINKQPYLEKE